jgi:hypothetical protein
MSVEQEQQWITGEEFVRTWRELMARRAPQEDPEYQKLVRRVSARDDHLFERYGKQHMETHRGKWIAISTDGQVIITDRAVDATRLGRERFGPGNYTSRRLTKFPGYRFG